MRGKMMTAADYRWAIEQTDGTIAAVAAKLGVSKNSARSTINNHGLAFTRVHSAVAARNAEVAERVRNGETRTDIAREYGLDLAVVSRACKAAGVPPGGYSGRVPTHRRIEIVERVKNGEVRSQLAREYGVSGPTVARICQAAGLPPPARPSTTARNAEIAERVRRGEQRQDLAREYGVTAGRVSQICKAAGVPPTTRRSAEDIRLHDLLRSVREEKMTTRTLFHAGHIPPRTQPDCTETHHVGPRVESELLRNAGHPWSLLAHCGACGSTVARWKIAEEGPHE